MKVSMRGFLRRNPVEIVTLRLSATKWYVEVRRGGGVIRLPYRAILRPTRASVLRYLAIKARKVDCVDGIFELYYARTGEWRPESEAKAEWKPLRDARIGLGELFGEKEAQRLIWYVN